LKAATASKYRSLRRHVHPLALSGHREITPGEDALKPTVATPMNTRMKNRTIHHLDNERAPTRIALLVLPIPFNYQMIWVEAGRVMTKMRDVKDSITRQAKFDPHTIRDNT
jgi:hypothetical protein